MDLHIRHVLKWISLAQTCDQGLYLPMENYEYSDCKTPCFQFYQYLMYFIHIEASVLGCRNDNCTLVSNITAWLYH